MRYRTRSWQTIEVDLGSTGLGVLECLSPRPTFCPSGMVLSLQAIATRAQSLGSVKYIQSHLRYSRADTTANEYMQELPESVPQMVGTVFAMLTRKDSSQMEN
jgi:hypothetical protein